MNNNYEPVRSYSSEEASAILSRGIADELRIAVIGVSLHEDDLEFAEQFCMNLVDHEDELVRGNAILGFGHLARRFEKLSCIQAKQIIELGLRDSSEYVRGQAWAAADDTSHFLNWKIEGFDG